MRLALLLASLLLTGCDVDRPPEAYAHVPTETVTAEPMLAEARARMTAAADSMDAVLRPVAFLRGSEEAALRRFMSREHLARARRLGITPPDDSTALGALTRDGRLVRLADSTEHYNLRELDHSFPLVTPATAALLEQIGERFQARLAEMGLPPLRIEVSSVLRTAALQADLRRSNSNAARGTSAHEFGTTVDVAYNSFAAPPAPVADLPADAPAWLRPHLRWMDRLAVERIAAQRSGELKAILGRVLIEMQSEGLVLITLEERQPVYHLTVAR